MHSNARLQIVHAYPVYALCVAWHFVSVAAGPVLALRWPRAGPELAPLALRRSFAMQRYTLKLPAYR